jgi:hypothetical protein
MEERIAQSVWVAVGADEDISQFATMDHIIRRHGVGGLIFKQGNASQQRELISHYQSVSKVPLAVAMEDECEPYPNPMALGAIVSDSLKYHMGKRMARQFVGLGIQVFLTPYGDENVSAALHENHILSTGKYTQGPGDTKLDSSIKALPGFDKQIAGSTTEKTGLAICLKQGDTTAGSAIKQIQSWLENGLTDVETITHRARMILACKYWTGLHPSPQTKSADDKAFIRDLYKSSLTLLNN